LWTLEIRDHALGRLAQRSPGVGFDEAIFEAHRAVLDTQLVRFKGNFLSQAGDGGFVCSLTAGRDKAIGGPCVCISAHTWIHYDRFAENQTFAASGGDRLGDNLLMPVALRHWIDVPRIDDCSPSG